MKILIVNEFYSPIQKGGAEVSVQFLAESFKKKGHEVFIVCSGAYDDVYCVNEIPVYKVRGNPVGWNGGDSSNNKIVKILWHLADVYNISVKKRIAAIIKKEKPDIVFTNNIAHFSCSVWSTAKKIGVPIVHTLRDYNLICPKRTMFNHHQNCEKRCFFCKTLSIANKVVSQKVSGVVGISRHILKRHLDAGLFLNSKTKVIFNSVDNLASDKNKKHSFNIGYLGKIHESKGTDFLIDAFSKCKNNQYSLLVAGDGSPDYINDLKLRIPAEKKDSIHFIGKVDRNAFFKKIDLLVVPSIWEEPFGRIVIEAIAANIPVIAAASGGIPEILKGYDKLGWLYEPYDEDSLIEKLEQFMAGKINFDFTEKTNFMKLFSSDEIATQYINFFQDVVKK